MKDKLHRFLALFAAPICCIAFLCALTFAGCSESDGAVIGNYVVDGGEESGTAEEDGSDAEESGLKIAKAELTSSAQFFGITVNGTYMEVIALVYNSAYRTAFNTCQVCYGSSKAYYKQSGSYLVCQNCGSKTALSKVGTSSTSCNPYPILEIKRADTDEYVVIPDSYLISQVKLFRNWGG